MNVCREKLPTGPTPRYLKLCGSQSLMNVYCAQQSKFERSNENQRYYSTELHHCATTGITKKKNPQVQELVTDAAVLCCVKQSEPYC